MKNGFSRIVVPEASAREASLVDGVEILPFANLAQLAAYLRKEIQAAAGCRLRLKTKITSRRK